MRLDRLLDDARQGMSGVLVLRGEPGVGKTALLDYAHAAAADMRVIRIDGVETELELSFAALHQFLRPCLGSLDILPAPQQTALRLAFGMQEGRTPDRFLAGLAALGLLAGHASRRPLLCLVDDAHWLDRESADALAFVARRVYADSIAMIFAVREPAPRHALLDGLPELGLGRGRDRGGQVRPERQRPDAAGSTSDPAGRGRRDQRGDRRAALPEP
jgi:predicted ATPase